MGDWPTIFDKSATLKLSDGRRFFVASPLGLGDIGWKIASSQTKALHDSICCTLEGRQDKNINKMTQLLRLVEGIGASNINNQTLPSKVHEHLRHGKLIALPLPLGTPVPLTHALGVGKSLSTTLVNIPALSDIDLDNPDVPRMSENERMMWVVLKCGEILDKSGKTKVAEAFKKLLEPQVIGMVVAGLIVWGASHFVGIGFIFDIAAVVVIGLAVLKAFETMWDIYKIISSTAQKSDLERAAQMMADMVIDIGVETFLAIVLKGAAKSRFRAPPSKAAGRGDDVIEYATPAPKRVKSKSTAHKKNSKTDETKKKNLQTLISARKKTARDFYRKQGWSEGKIDGHMKGIDFTQPVEVVNLKKGTVVGQWQSPGAPKGNYFAPLDETPDRLGISSVGHNRATGNAEPKIQQTYKLKDNIDVLSSKAAAVVDDWSSPYGSAVTKGGGQQYFVPDITKFVSSP